MASLKDLPVLVVDDNESMRGAISAVLRKIGFQNITACGDIIEAWRILSKGGVGFVLCEALVGGKFGIHLLKKVRATPPLAKIPFLVMSSRKERAIADAHMNAGASEFVAKPFDAAILLAKLKKALSAQAAAAPAKQAPEAKQSPEAKLLELGRKALEGYDAQTAIAYFTKAARANPKCVEAFIGLAQACKHKKDIPQFLLFMNSAARLMIERGDMAEAEKIYQELRLHDPQAPNPFALAGNTLATKGNLAAARKLLQHAVAVEPDNALHFLALGDTLLRLGDKEAATEQVTAALKIQDDFPDARKLFKAITGKKWTDTEGSLAYAKRAKEEEAEAEKHGTVRFWVPDLLLAVKGHKEHFALTEMSLRALAFSHMGDTFVMEDVLKFDILKLTEAGTEPEIKHLKGAVTRCDEETVGIRLQDVTPAQEQEIQKILDAAQKRQKEQGPEEKKEVIKFDIDMLFM